MIVSRSWSAPHLWHHISSVTQHKMIILSLSWTHKLLVKIIWIWVSIKVLNNSICRIISSFLLLNFRKQLQSAAAVLYYWAWADWQSIFPPPAVPQWAILFLQSTFRVEKVFPHHDPCFPCSYCCWCPVHKYPHCRSLVTRSRAGHGYIVTIAPLSTRPTHNHHLRLQPFDWMGL